MRYTDPHPRLYYFSLWTAPRLALGNWHAHTAEKTYDLRSRLESQESEDLFKKFRSGSKMNDGSGTYVRVVFNLTMSVTLAKQKIVWIMLIYGNFTS